MYFNDYELDASNELEDFGLNPYCNGCTSMITRAARRQDPAELVSILIVMDVLQ